MLLALILRGLAPHITYTMAIDDPERASRGGWVFDEPEPVFGARDLRSALCLIALCVMWSLLDSLACAKVAACSGFLQVIIASHAWLVIDCSRLGCTALGLQNIMALAT